MDGERMYAALELGAKYVVDHAVAFEPALSAKSLRHDIDPEMSLPADLIRSMPGVLMGFVQNLQALGGESLGQLVRDQVAPCHDVAYRERDLQVNRARSRANAVVKT